MKPKDENEPDREVATLDPNLDAMIGAKLRTYFDTLASEPVPDRIIELLTKLDAKERNNPPGSH
ncbi:MAG: hypothetical protein LCH38_05430 [Proteobacteria bacterium]|nr:hypothetical protein [Pseudomonadota bacterium]